MGRGGIQVVVELFDVLAVIALFAGQAEQPLLEDRIAPVPQCQPQAQALPQVAKTGQTILAPAVGAAARVLMRKVFPRIAVRTVVLAYRGPLALGQIGAPFLPAFAFG